MKVAIFTSANGKYFDKAFALHASLIKHFSRSFDFYIAMAETNESEWIKIAQTIDPDIKILPISALMGKEFGKSHECFQLNVVELCTAIKPFAFQRLFDQGYEKVIYLDPDTFALSDMSEMLDWLDTTSAIITPHMLAPATTHDEVKLHELSCLLHGAFNLGFLACKNDDSGRLLINWWKTRVEKFCFSYIPGGVFTDQKWFDLAVGFFPFLTVLRDPAYNVASWNLSQRPLKFENEQWLMSMSSKPVRFFHFSGYDAGTHDKTSVKYANDASSIETLNNLYSGTLKAFREKIHALNSPNSWSLGYFEDGRPILNLFRVKVRHNSDIHKSHPNLYAKSAANYFYSERDVKFESFYNDLSPNALFSFMHTMIQSRAYAIVNVMRKVKHLSRFTKNENALTGSSK